MTRHRSLRMLCILNDTLRAVLLVAVAVLMVVGLSAPGAVASAAGLGKSILAVTSGSMSPLLRVGDAIVADVDVDPAKIAVGDIIVFRSAASPDLLVTHRVVALRTTAAGDHTFVTGGDANGAPDTVPVSREQIVGRLETRLPKVGYVLAAADNAAVVSLFAAGSVLSHGALFIARSAGTSGAGHRRGDPNHRKDTQ